MRKMLVGTILGLAMMCGSVRADWVVVQTTKAAGKETLSTVSIKEGKARTDQGEEMSIILEDGGAVILMHPQKQKMVMDAAAMKNMMEMASKMLGAGGEPAAPVATGQKEKVGDWDAEIFTWKSPLGDAKFWVARDFPKFKELAEVMDKMARSLGGMAAMMPKSSDLPGMVVKSEMKVMGQAAESVLVSAKEETLSADLFAVPEGYSEIKMPAMPGAAPKP